MSYWQIIMRSCYSINEDYTEEQIKNILKNNLYIGINEWNDPICDKFKKIIKKGDIVLVNATPNIGVAIVKVVDYDYYKKPVGEIGFENRRKIEIIRWLKDDEKILPSKSKQSKAIFKTGKNIEYMKQVLKDDKDKIEYSDMMEKIINDSERLLNNKKQIILYGPAGTGKTYNTKNIIEEHSGEKFEELKNSDRVKLVTFHQSFAYEDFIEGIKPKTENESVTYRVEDGIFKELCRKARSKSTLEFIKKDLKIGKSYIVESVTNELINIKKINENNIIPMPKQIIEEVLVKYKSGIITKEQIKNKQIGDKLNSETYILHGYSNIFEQIINIFDEVSENIENINENYYLIIDEINRGNISKIFGELITLLEASKRLGETDELTTTLPYSKEKFGIPPNLYIIGTMNTSDKSIAHLDIALRRRFGFVEMLPDYDQVSTDKENPARMLLQILNYRIKILLDKDHLIGHSFFMPKKDEDNNDIPVNIEQIMQYEIVPLLEEYFYGDYEKIQLILGKGTTNLTCENIPLGDCDKDIYQYWFEKPDEKFDVSLSKEKQENISEQSNDQQETA